MEKQDYLKALRRETDALVAVARFGLGAAVPSCPGWQVGDVVAHVGQAMNWMSELVETKAQAPLWSQPNDHGFDWHAPGSLDWFVESRDRFLAVTEAADPEEPVWSWAGDNRVLFWLRLEAMEAAIHRWDAQGARREREDIDPALAADAVDATIRWFLPVRRRRSTLPDRGERYHFDQTDGSGRWLVRFADGTVMSGRGSEEADATATGTASDILLFIWGRMPVSALRVSGDAEVMERFFRLVPSI
jgi:uncharacterized protein (TIGR03083 family)